MTDKPSDVFDRDREWADLVEFAAPELPGLRIAVVYGRRRQGKSYLLRRLTEARGGLYHLATEQAEALSVRRFGEALAAWQGLPAGSLAFDGWERALNTAAEFAIRRGPGFGPGTAAADGHPAAAPLLVLDEFPYLSHETPGLPSIVQSLYDRIGPGASSGSGAADGSGGSGGPVTPAPLRLILCGSAISVMSGLLSGTKALRGRGALELLVRPFNYRDARAYWGIENPRAAFLHNALMGGTPGYRELVPDPRVPEDPARMGAWLARNVLRPSVPLFDEANRVVHEDPRIRGTAAYASILAVVAAGESSPTKIGGLLERPANSLIHQIGMLESAGFIERTQDLLLERRPTLAVADPVVRLHHLVIEPYQADLEDGRATEVWREVGHTVDSKILGPHFEAIATAWVRRHARDEAGLDVGATGPGVVACPEHRIGHEIDVMSLARGARPRTAGTAVAFLGEAKSRERRPGLAQLERLEHVRDLLTARGHDASGARFGLFSTSGFTEELTERARRSGDTVLLVGLEELYGA